MVSANAVPYLEPLTGDPGILESASATCVSIADQIQAVSDALTILADKRESIGKSVDAMRDETTLTAEAVKTVIPRYETTASALSVYAVELREAQRLGTEALTAVDNERTQLWSLYSSRDQVLENLNRSSVYMADPATVDAEIVALNSKNDAISLHETLLDDAIVRFYAAEDKRDTAAHYAADVIQAEYDVLNDGFFEKIGDLLGSAVDFLAAIGEWIAEVLEQVVQWASDLVIVVLALVLLATAVLLYGAPALLGWMTWDEVLDAGIGATMIVLTAFSSQMRVLKIEAEAPTPNMTFIGATVRSAEDDPYGEAFTDAQNVDTAGKGDSTVVTVVLVGTGTDGKPIWRVIPPSTQDWELASDSGAANDLGSNLMLMLSPDEKAAYERMVIQAMEKAGIGPDDHVMMVGFSQGGILAGKWAADPSLPFNIEAIVVAGAPIDAMDIPPSVSVVSIQHRGDPVHHLDGTAAPTPNDNWVTIDADPYDPKTGKASSSGFFNAAVHDVQIYRDTAVAVANGSMSAGGYLSQEDQGKFDSIAEDQSKFFSEYENVYQYEGVEG